MVRIMNKKKNNINYDTPEPNPHEILSETNNYYSHDIKIDVKYKNPINYTNETNTVLNPQLANINDALIEYGISVEDKDKCDKNKIKYPNKNILTPDLVVIAKRGFSFDINDLKYIISEVLNSSPLIKKDINELVKTSIQILSNQLIDNIDDIILDIANINKNIADMLSEYSKNNDLIENKLTTIEHTVIDNSSSINQLNENISDINSSINLINIELSADSSNIDNNTTHINQILANISSINTQLSNNSDSITAINTKLVENDHNITSINNSISSINTELSDNSLDISNIKNTINTHSANISSILDSITAINNNINQINNSITSINLEISNSNKSITNNTKAIDTINTELISISTSIQTLSTTLNSHTSDINILQTNVAKNTSDINALTITINNIPTNPTVFTNNIKILNYKYYAYYEENSITYVIKTYLNNYIVKRVIESSGNYSIEYTNIFTSDSLASIIANLSAQNYYDLLSINI